MGLAAYQETPGELAVLFKSQENILTAHLDDALEQEICPICFLGNEAEYRYLDTLLYEHINDGITRNELEKSRGFCTYHTHRLLEVGGYGVHAKVAIIYKDLVDAIADEVRTLDEGRACEIDMNANCPACRAIAEREHVFMGLLSTRLSKEAVRERYRRSPGLCMRHFFQVYDLSKRAPRAFLKADQLGRLSLLSGDLAEFIRKSVVQTEPFGDERDVWIRVIRFYAGTLKQ
jgi:hypothetical protein